MVASPAFSYPSVVNAGIPARSAPASTSPSYHRIRDEFVDVQLRAQSMRQGYYEAKSDGLDQVELALAEPGDTGLNSLLDKYWYAWQDVANAPENLATRQALVQAAGALADGFRTLSSQLDDDPVADRGERHRRRSARSTRSASRSSTSTCRSRTRPRSATRRTTCSTSATCWSTSSRSSATSRRPPGTNGAIDVTFAGATLVTGTTSSRDARRERPRRASPPASSPASSASATRCCPATRAQLDAIAERDSSPRRTRCTTRATTSNGIAGGDFFSSAARPPRRSRSTRPSSPSPGRSPPPRRRGEPGDAHDRARDRRPPRRQLDRRRLPAARHHDRLRLAGGAALARQRDAARRRAREPPRQRLGRLARRGDDEPDALPARLPGLVPRAHRDGRDDRPARSTAPEGSGCDRPHHPVDDDAARCSRDIQDVSAQPRARRTQKLSSGKELTKPSDDPYATSRALQYRARARRRTSSTSATSTRRTPGRTSPTPRSARSATSCCAPAT